MHQLMQRLGYPISKKKTIAETKKMLLQQRTKSHHRKIDWLCDLQSGDRGNPMNTDHSARTRTLFSFRRRRAHP
jgi:hypothetical protein